MADIVQAEWAPGETGGRGGPGCAARRQQNGESAEETDENKKNYIVVWDPADQARLSDDYDWMDPPSPLDVRYAQEELWVLEAICKAIDKTNVGATGDFDAVVREIQSTLDRLRRDGQIPARRRSRPDRASAQARQSARPYWPRTDGGANGSRRCAGRLAGTSIRTEATDAASHGGSSGFERTDARAGWIRRSWRRRWAQPGVARTNGAGRSRGVAERMAAMSIRRASRCSARNGRTLRRRNTI